MNDPKKTEKNDQSVSVWILVLFLAVLGSLGTFFKFFFHP